MTASLFHTLPLFHKQCYTKCIENVSWRDIVLAGVTVVNAETFEVIVTKLEDGESLNVDKIAGYNAG